MNDEETGAYNYLTENPPSVLQDLSSPLQFPEEEQANQDDAILSDMELGIREQLINTETTETTITEETLRAVIPPFTRLQRFNPSQLQNMNSVIGVVASVTPKSVLYSPIPETGVITATTPLKVTLSQLNSDSGILQEKIFPMESVALHKDRLLYYIGNVKLLRGTTGRICTVLAMKYIRELFICLLYYAQCNALDVLEAWPLSCDDLVRLTKFTFVSNANNRILNPSKQNQVTLVSCLFRILKGSLKKLSQSSSKGLQLMKSLTLGVWTDASSLLSPLSSISSPSPSSTSTSGVASPSFQSSHLARKHSQRTSSIQLLDDEMKMLTISSLHPLFDRNKYEDQVILPGVEGLRVVFDRRCKLDASNAMLTFFRDENHSEVIAKFTGDSSTFCPFTIRGNELRYQFESSAKAVPTWGYAFMIQPFEHVRWIGDSDVLQSSCFDWNCFALELAMEMCKAKIVSNTQFFRTVMRNLISYLRSVGMPFKSRVIELLIRLLYSSHVAMSALPNVEGMYSIVLRYCEGINAETVVPVQLPLLIEFLASYANARQLKTLSIPDDPSVLPPFVESVAPLEDSLRTAIDSVYLLTRCLYCQTIPPAPFLQEFLRRSGKPWNQAHFEQIVQCFRRFTRRLDLSLISALEQRCAKDHATMLTFPLADFALTDDDKARYYGLNSFSPLEVRMRLAFIQFFNSRLQRVVHLIELGSPWEDGINTLGKLLGGLTGYIFPSVKENALEVSILQTIYHGKDCYPVVELDNRRAFTELERSQMAGDAEFDEEARNAMTSQCTFAQLFRQTRKFKVDVLRAKLDSRERLLAVKYKGEQGLDWGGIYRDMMERCIEDLFSDRIDLFIPSPNSQGEEKNDDVVYLPNPKYRESSDALAMYGFVGNLIGISLRTKQLMSFELCSAIWKTIVGDAVTSEDVESVDRAFINTLNQVRDFEQSGDAEDFQYLFGLTFAVPDSAGNEVELIPSGAQVSVSFENRAKFVQLALDYRLNEWKQAAEAIASGVYALVPQRALSLFTWEQLERAVQGAPEVESWKRGNG